MKGLFEGYCSAHLPEVGFDRFGNSKELGDIILRLQRLGLNSTEWFCNDKGERVALVKRTGHGWVQVFKGPAHKNPFKVKKLDGIAVEIFKLTHPPSKRIR
jgi:hypothetical protein